jgi:hypothetical protein
MKSPDVTLGPVRIRFELILIVAGIAALADVYLAIAFSFVVLLHEVAHFLAARSFGDRRSQLILGVAGGGSYTRDLGERGRKIAVLLAGPMVTALSALIGWIALLVAPHPQWAALFFASAVWCVYQLSPFPPLDGGQILQILLGPRMRSATLLWRAQWVIGLAFAAGVALLQPWLIQEVVLLSGLALVLGRSESGYVRHLDAYSAWEKGDHKTVLKMVRALPDYLDKGDKTALLELGLMSAIELQDEAAVEELAQLLPAYRPEVLKSAEWLLMKNSSIGAKLAQRALDALDAEQVKPGAEDMERFADVAFRFAVYEARNGTADSAIGLLERAIGFGFSDLDRLEADAAFQALRSHPRYRPTVDRIVR